MEEITICIPVYKRHEFLGLTAHNIKSQTYPHDKLTVLIDECRSNEPFIRDISQLRQFLHPIKVIHNVYNKRATIGEKRNRLVKTCKTKYIQFMDTDDLYRKDCILYNYQLLKENRCKCVGSDKMIFCYMNDSFKLTAIDCGDKIHMIHEATLLFEKKWFNSTNKFIKNSQGEGRNLFYGINKKDVFISDVNKIMICLVHNSNTINKDRFKQKDMPSLEDSVINILKALIDIPFHNNDEKEFLDGITDTQPLKD
tara:strand:- start:6590 stop:7351 length:762 start_codon:yes stop_codon:yes gene_type:complete